MAERVRESVAMTSSHRDLLRVLLGRLDNIAHDHDELFDSVVRERMAKAIFNAFLKPVAGFHLPEDFGMSSEEANARIFEALHEYVTDANKLQEERALDFHGRLTAFQDETVEVGQHG